MRRILLWTVAFFGLIILAAVVAGLIYNEPLPKGKEGPEADALAHKMLTAIDKAAWDTTGAVQWTFAGKHDFLWDRARNFVEVKWGEKAVLLNTQTLGGRAWRKEVELSGEDKDIVLKQAWSLFCNDSFWLNAPAKVFDPGTKRSLVTLEDGSQGLLISYTSGGVTPGDAYLWILNDKGLPLKWKMWVKIIPIGGLGTTWENWITLPSGAKLASSHKNGTLGLEISNIKGAVHLMDLIQDDPFLSLMTEQ